ncbi:MAG: hypothetical protein KGL46_02740 [Hyphomicrobiales bacterium]|nr:hypothetical protein [Hyphomicrobiales bacterium]
MSLFDRSRASDFSARRIILACALALSLGGCVHPIYGAFGAPGLVEELQAIKVEPMPDRLGHYLANELMFALNGTGSDVAPKYRLFVSFKERAQTPVIDTVTGRATSASVIVDAEWSLMPIAGGEPVARGVAFGAVSYDRTLQRISNVRAARDAETRNAKMLADQIRQQIAAQFSARG